MGPCWAYVHLGCPMLAYVAPMLAHVGPMLAYVDPKISFFPSRTPAQGQNHVNHVFFTSPSCHLLAYATTDAAHPSAETTPCTSKRCCSKSFAHGICERPQAQQLACAQVNAWEGTCHLRGQIAAKTGMLQEFMANGYVRVIY